jgi:hypothetical protein
MRKGVLLGDLLPEVSSTGVEAGPADERRWRRRKI